MNLEFVAIIISALTPIILYFSRNTILEWIKSSFTREIEQFKHDLDIQKELIRQDLNREAQKALYQSSSKQSIYPELFEKLRVCEGSVGLLHGLRYVTDYNSLPNVELEKIINKSKSPESTKKRLIEELNNNRQDAVKLIQDEFARIELFDARLQCQELKNFLILKSLYFSKNVRDKSFEVVSLLTGIIVDLDLYKQTNQMPMNRIREDQKKVETTITDIEQMMRKEIFGETT